MLIESLNLFGRESICSIKRQIYFEVIMIPKKYKKGYRIKNYYTGNASTSIPIFIKSDKLKFL